MNDFWREVERRLIGENLSAEPGGLETSVQPIVAAAGVAGAAVSADDRSGDADGLLEREQHGGPRLESAAGGDSHGDSSASWCLMLYGWTVQRHRTDLPDVVVVLDDSASMGLVDQYDDASLAAEIKRRLAS